MTDTPAASRSRAPDASSKPTIAGEPRCDVVMPGTMKVAIACCKQLFASSRTSPGCSGERWA